MAFADKKKGYDYINKYKKENYDRIQVQVEKGKKALYQEAAGKMGFSLSSFIELCVDKEVKNNQKTT